MNPLLHQEKKFKRGERILIPRQTFSCSGVADDLSQENWIPITEQTLMRQVVVYRITHANETRTNKSFLCRSKQKPQRWNTTETRAVDKERCKGHRVQSRELSENGHDSPDCLHPELGGDGEFEQERKVDDGYEAC